MRTCKRCNGEFSDSFFKSLVYEKTSDSRCYQKKYEYKRLVCEGCFQKDRTTAKRTNRPKEKARRTIRSHVEKYIKLGAVENTEEFIERFSWYIDQIAHDIEHAYKNGCAYCHELFSGMGNGLVDVTLDIINPKEPPYYKTNTKWVCNTCNNAKKGKSPQEWEERMYSYKLWKKQQEKLNHNPYAGLPMFDMLQA